MKNNVLAAVLLVVVTTLFSCLERTDLIVDENIPTNSTSTDNETEGIIPRDTLIRQGGWEKLDPSGPYDRLFLQFQPETLMVNRSFNNITPYKSWRIVGDTLEAYQGSASPFRSLCYQVSYKPVAPGADTGCPPADKICRPDTLYAVECGEEDTVAFIYEWQDNQ